MNNKIIYVLVIVSLLIKSSICVSYADYGDNPIRSGSYEYIVVDGGAEIVCCDENVSGKIIIPSTLDGYPVLRIGDEAFVECKKINAVVVPDGVTYIGKKAFYFVLSLKEIYLPDSVTELDDMAFGHSSIKKLNLPKELKRLGNSVFSNCTNLEGIVEIPQGVKIIGQNAFENCNKVTDFLIPDTVCEIGNYAFRACKSVKSIVIPEKIRVLDGVFYGCTSLSSIYLPTDIENIKIFTFMDCPLKNVYYGGTEEQWENGKKLNFSGVDTKYKLHYNFKYDKSKSIMYSVYDYEYSTDYDAFEIIGEWSYRINEYEIEDTVYIPETAVMKCASGREIQIYKVDSETTVESFCQNFAEYIEKYHSDIPADYRIEDITGYGNNSIILGSGTYILSVSNSSENLFLKLISEKVDAEISVYLNGIKVEFDVSPVIENGHTLVPVRALFESLNSSVDWNEEKQCVIIKQESWDDITKTIHMPVNSKEVFIQYSTPFFEHTYSEELDVAPIIIQERTLVPLRFLCENLGYDVEWDNSTKSVYLYSSQGSNTVVNNINTDIYSNPMYEGYRKWSFDNGHIGWTDVTMNAYINNQSLWGNAALMSLNLFDMDISEISNNEKNKVYDMVDILITPTTDELMRNIYAKRNQLESASTLNNVAEILSALDSYLIDIGAFDAFDKKIADLLGDGVESLDLLSGGMNVIIDSADELIGMNAILEESEENRKILLDFINDLPYEIHNRHSTLFALMTERLEQYDNFSYGAMFAQNMIENGKYELLEGAVKSASDYIHKGGGNTAVAIVLDLVRLGIDIVAQDQLSGIEDANIFSLLYVFQNIAHNHYSKLWVEAVNYDGYLPLDVQRKIKNAAVVSMVSGNRTRDLFIKHRKEIWFGDDGRECDREGYYSLEERNKFVEEKLIKRWKEAIVE